MADPRRQSRIAACLVPLAGLASQAEAIDYTPQVGTWLIDEEFNGKPGRGFQMDVQNDVLVLPNRGGVQGLVECRPGRPRSGRAYILPVFFGR